MALCGRGFVAYSAIKRSAGGGTAIANYRQLGTGADLARLMESCVVVAAR